MGTDPRAALARLQDAAADGRLDALCARHGVRVLTVFGSCSTTSTRSLPSWPLTSSATGCCGTPSSASSARSSSSRPASTPTWQRHGSGRVQVAVGVELARTAYRSYVRAVADWLPG